jgi:hypothetical protein
MQIDVRGKRISIHSGREEEVAAEFHRLIKSGAKYICAPLRDPDDGTWFADVESGRGLRIKLTLIIDRIRLKSRLQ